MEETNDTKDREIKISRVLNAPIELVWKVFTEPEHIAQWWGPTGFSNTINIMDVRAGGKWEFVMHGPDGATFNNKSIFSEVVKHQRIVFDHFHPNFKTTITFTAEGKKTVLNWHLLFETAEELQTVIKVFKADEGLKQNIIKLEQYLLIQ